jgi:hypothetical protein
MIHTARTYLRAVDQATHIRMLRTSMAPHKQDPALMPPPTEVDEKAAPAVAVVQRGAWVAYCPTRGCGSGEFVEPDTPFFCCVCANAELDHRWRPVAWPAQRRAIEAALGERPLPHTRNWLPGETPGSLRKEFAAARAADLGLVLP